MQRIYIIIIILHVCTSLFGQTKGHTKPFIIKGQFTDYPETHLYITYSDKHGEPLMDTVYLDEKGNFYLKSFKVKEPQRVEIKGSKTGIRNLFVAPGYELKLTGNGRDRQSLMESKKISGKGSENNRYYAILDSIQNARTNGVNWLDLNENDLLSYAKELKKLKDSIAHSVFNRPGNQDNFKKHFRTMVQMDNMFYYLYMLVTHIYWNDYDYEKSISLLRNNFDNKILDAIYKDQYLTSNDYRKWVITGGWVHYLVHLDSKKDSTLSEQKNYSFKKVNETYKGAAKDYALYKLIGHELELSSSFEEINDFREIFDVYTTKLKNHQYKASLQSKLAAKVTELQQVQIGKPAPSFSLVSNLGNRYTLNDFKNKVVYLDLWASWCVPCREETPSFKALYEKYKNDERIAFVSIAVHDQLDKWKKALDEDQPAWIQLLDKDGIVAKAYAAFEIPRFVLIDKKGKIVHFDAPRPSSRKEIESLLNLEIEK